MTITTDSIIKIDRTLAATKVGEETVVFDDESGTYIGLSEVGTVIFDRLNEPRAVSFLIDNLRTVYDVDQETCKKDVITFLERMHEAKLISVT